MKKTMASKMAIAAVFAGIGCASASSSTNLWWVSDEEREFLKRRTTHIDFIPGTPEGNAKRFYYDEAKTKYVEFNYDEYVARDKKNPDIIKAIYLKEEFSGFAVHLVQK